MPLPSGDRTPLDAFLEVHGATVREAARRLCRRPIGLQPEDLEQEIRLRLWRILEGETEITDPASYIRRVALTATIDAVRRAKARREDPLPEPGTMEGARAGRASAGASRGLSPEADASGRETFRRVNAALARIPESRRKPVFLHLQGFTTDEIARLLRFTGAAARNLVYRGLEDLRRELQREGIGYDAGS